MSKRAPILYEGFVDIRFADLDPYNHVNSKHYIDLVATVRLNYLANVLKRPLEEATAHGVGFYLTKSTIHYKRPITGLPRVKVTSFVEDIRDGKVLVVPFKIMNESGAKIFSDGVLEFTCVDIKTQRSTAVPEWSLALYFEKAGAD